MKNYIKNFSELATSENRKLALTIAEAGLAVIDTEEVILRSVKLQDNILSVQGKSFDLSKFKKIKVVGFGKASMDGALALEKVFTSNSEFFRIFSILEEKNKSSSISMI